MTASLPWLRLYDEVLDDPKVQRLTPKEFRKQLYAAIAGERNAWSRHLEGPFYDNLRPPAHVWKELRAVVFERDDYTCTYCGERGVRLECDHIHPVSRGGSHDLDNLTTACFSCNRSKRDKTLEEWDA